MKVLKSICVMIMVMMFCMVANLAVLAEDKTLPANAGYMNVKNFGAKGDGINDDTLAIQSAINGRTGGEIIYFPKGTYLISDTLQWIDKCARTILQGENETETIIKLKNDCSGYLDENVPKEMIWTGEAPAQRFRNGIRDLTIDTGTGNYGAIGVQYMSNNQGNMQNVTIRSGDGRGVYGLDLGYSDENGPCLIKNVRIVGFDVGIRTKHGVDSQTLEYITLEGQKKYGFTNEGQVLSIYGLKSINTVPAFWNKSGSGLVTLLDSNLTGGSSSNAAIINDAGMFVRNLTTLSYGMAIQNSSGTRESVQGPNVEEFVSHAILSKFPSPAHSLNLPIKKTPVVTWDTLDKWANVADYPAKEVTTTDINGNTVTVMDYTDSFQKAIDSGKTTVYFPVHGYNIIGTVHIRGAVKRIIGLDHELSRNFKPTFVIEDGSAPVVVIERLSTMYCPVDIVQASSRTVVISAMFANSVTAQANTGDVFFEDTYIGHLQLEPGTHVWARQYDSEGAETKIHNNGGTLWILGFK